MPFNRGVHVVERGLMAQTAEMTLDGGWFCVMPVSSLRTKT